MEPWGRSSITPQRLEGLVHHGLLRPLTTVEEWRLPGNEDEPSPPEGYVVSFAHFHKRGIRHTCSQLSSGAVGLLPGGVAAPYSQWGLAHYGVRHPV